MYIINIRAYLHTHIYTKPSHESGIYCLCLHKEQIICKENIQMTLNYIYIYIYISIYIYIYIYIYNENS